MAVDAEEAQFHVLAVDDSLIDRKLIERLLRTSSYQGIASLAARKIVLLVTTVDSGIKALEVLGFREDPTSPSPASPDQNELEVNLVITDYFMPGMTGYDLLKKIKGSSSLKDIPVVIMSSENVPSTINRCLEEGAEEFFLKPVRLSDMKRLRLHILKERLQEQQQQQQQQEEDQPQEEETSEGGSGSSGNEDNDNSNKRKAMDEGPPSERTRPKILK